MTRQVALADETYDRLRRARLPGESFSEAIERLLSNQPKDPMSFLATVPRSSISPEARLAQIEADRETTRTDV